MITDELEALTSEGIARLGAAATVDELRAARQELLGKRSALAAYNQRLGSMAPEERREAGRRVNEARAALETAADERGRILGQEERRLRLEAERLDLTEVPPGDRKSVV